MADKRCENGHFIDESWDLCPYCPAENAESDVPVVRPTRFGEPPRPVAVPPEIPASVVDPAVRSALAEAREKVLAESQSAQAWGELGYNFRAHNLNVESNACFAVAALST